MSASYCLRCRRNTENVNPQLTKTRNNRNLLTSNCHVCGVQKYKFVSLQDAKDGVGKKTS